MLQYLLFNLCVIMIIGLLLCVHFYLMVMIMMMYLVHNDFILKKILCKHVCECACEPECASLWLYACTPIFLIKKLTS